MFLMKWFKRKKNDERIGQLWVEEVLPEFHDRAKTKNKTVWVVAEVIVGDIVIAYCLDSMSLYKKEKVYGNHPVLTQNEIPIVFNKKGKPKSVDLFFKMDGYRKGDIYHFEHMGFLAKTDSIKEVWLVTDQYVLFRYLRKSGSIVLYSYKELNNLQPKKRG